MRASAAAGAAPLCCPALADCSARRPAQLQALPHQCPSFHKCLSCALPRRLRRRDVIPAAEECAADAAAAGLAAGDDVNSLPTGSFDWDATAAALAQLARDAPPSAAAAGAAGGGPATGAGSGGGAGDGAPASQLPAELALVGREQPNPLGRAWAGVWPGHLPGQPGPLHVVFGHDAKR